MNALCLYISSKDKDTYQYFKNIKMNLYKKQYFIKSSNGKEADIEIIISKLLNKISDEAIKQIERHIVKKVEKDEIKWVVTIPAIWDEKSKQIMINASKKAGLINDQTDISLFLALEPEAAGIFYFSKSYLRGKDGDEYNIPTVICDIGAGTVDICTYIKKKSEDEKNIFINMPKENINNDNLNINSNENIIELHNKEDLINNSNDTNTSDSILIEEYPPMGNELGGSYINEEFIRRLIEELFGKEKVEKLKNVKNERWKEFEEKIEKIKRTSSDNKQSYDCKLDCRLFEDKNKNIETIKKLNDYIDEYNIKQNKYKYQIRSNPEEDWELIFPSQIFLDITKETGVKVILILEEIFNAVKDAQIIFTGAGSKNRNLINFISDFFQSKNLTKKIKATYQPEISILKGAVLFGLQSNIIRYRKSKYTIGIKVSRNWNENLYNDGGIKEYSEFLKEDECINLFSKFITRNEYVRFDQIISHTVNAGGKKPLIVFYKTLKNDCKYIDEKDEKEKFIIEKFGEERFDIEEDFDMNNRMIKIDMKMGGTYITVEAKYIINGKSINTTQYFY